MVFAGISGRSRGFAEQPGDEDDEGGLEEFRRLDVDAEDHQPAPRALDLRAEVQASRATSTRLTTNTISDSAADLLRRLRNDTPA